MKNRIHGWFVAWLMLSLAFLTNNGLAGTRYDYTFQAHSYTGSETREYSVYVPDVFSGARPMVMALHGCLQTLFYQQDYDCEHIFFTQDGSINSRSLVETIFYRGPLQPMRKMVF